MRFQGYSRIKRALGYSSFPRMRGGDPSREFGGSSSPRLRLSSDGVHRRFAISLSEIKAEPPWLYSAQLEAPLSRAERSSSVAEASMKASGRSSA